MATAAKPGLKLGKLSQVAKMVVSTTEREIEIPLNKIKFDPNQPRKAFHHLDGRVADEDQAYIDELAVSIEQNGLIQAITVQEEPDGTYLVVIGECRTRAHLKLGKTTIRALVRNDLTSASKRMLVQLSENVNRKDLSDDEMALSIKELMEGIGGEPPMNQSAIAKYFGKSEGWVSRYVKYGEEDIQRLWVRPGIADTVEKAYRLSILPKAAQLDILRRVALPESDPDFLEKPLLRGVIDQLAREAKSGKSEARAMELGQQNGAVTPVVALPAASSHKPAGSIEQAIAESSASVPAARTGGGDASATSLSTNGYQLPDAARAAILGTIPAVETAAGRGERDLIAPPVNCRITVNNLVALLDIVKSKEELVAALRNVRCELSIPGPIAKQAASELMGVIVNDQEVPAVLQTELVKLN